MGKYDKEYEDYYKNIGDSKKSDDRYYSVNESNEPRYKPSTESKYKPSNEPRYKGNIDMYEARYNKKHNDGKKFDFAKIAIMVVAIPTIILGGILVYEKITGQDILVFKEFSFGDSSDKKTEDVVKDVSLDKNLENNRDESTIDSVNDEVEKEKKSKIISNVLYKGFVEKLKGIEIKAKSEEGIVLSCQYKILVNSVDGKVEEVVERKEGYYVRISHANDLETRYYNLDDVSVEVGQEVAVGTEISAVSEKSDVVFKIAKNDEFISPLEYVEYLE